MKGCERKNEEVRRKSKDHAPKTNCTFSMEGADFSGVARTSIKL
jgi:hypothetical protein